MRWRLTRECNCATTRLHSFGGCCGRMGNAANKGSFGEKQAGFLWIVPQSTPLEAKGIETDTSSGHFGSPCATHPKPAWFEMDDVSHELRWQSVAVSDIVLEEEMETRRLSGSDAACARSDCTELALSTPLHSIRLTDLRSISLLQTSKRTVNSTGFAPFLFRIQGESSRRSWTWTLQAPSAQELGHWVASLRKNIVSMYRSITDDTTAVFQAIKAGDMDGLLAVLGNRGFDVAPRDAKVERRCCSVCTWEMHVLQMRASVLVSCAGAWRTLTWMETLACTWRLRVAP